MKRPNRRDSTSQAQWVLRLSIRFGCKPWSFFCFYNTLLVSLYSNFDCTQDIFPPKAATQSAYFEGESSLPSRRALWMLPLLFVVSRLPPVCGRPISKTLLSGLSVWPSNCPSVTGLGTTWSPAKSFMNIKYLQWIRFYIRNCFDVSAGGSIHHPECKTGLNADNQGHLTHHSLESSKGSIMYRIKSSEGCK